MIHDIHNWEKLPFPKSLTPLSPRDNNGRFVPKKCPVCGGTLEYEGHGVWACDGLVDPETTDKELECCPFDHFDGEIYFERKFY